MHTIETYNMYIAVSGIICRSRICAFFGNTHKFRNRIFLCTLEYKLIKKAMIECVALEDLPFRLIIIHLCIICIINYNIEKRDLHKNLLSKLPIVLHCFFSRFSYF